MGEVATRTPTQELVAQVRGDTFAEEVAKALPDKIDAARFQRIAVTAILDNPELVTATQQSVFQAFMKCAADGLVPDGREAALVIYSGRDGKRAQYLPMIGGYRKIAAQNGISLNAHVVYEHDEFEYVLGVAPNVTHKPPKLGTDRGEPIGAYAVATYGDGRLVCPPEVMDRNQIEQVRRASRSADSEYGPWTKWWDRMARKTVARLLFKQLPLVLLEHEARMVAAADDEAELQGPRKMTESEANVAVQTRATVPADSEPPDDDWDQDDLGGTFGESDEYADFEPVPVDEAAGDPGSSLAEGEQSSFADRIPESAKRKQRTRG